jgi:DHA1 family bicyclomycin/chloramphenicol resistance-like MFS transporter
VLAPAVGGFVVEWGSWRLAFGLLAVIATLIAVLVARLLLETLAEDMRSPVQMRAAYQVVGKALQHRTFLGFVLMFGLIGAAQMVFGVVGPLLFQADLGFTPATYGLIALVVGVANLTGELACGALAQRLPTRQLAVSAWAVFVLGAAILVVSAAVVGVNAWAVTVGAAVALLGIGVLDPRARAWRWECSTAISG